MDQSDLKDRIRKGRVNAEDLPNVFAESAEITEELRLRAVGSVMRTDPNSAKPYFSRINTDRLADAIEQNRADPETISLAVRAYHAAPRMLDAAVRSSNTPTKALVMAAGKMTEAQLGPVIRDESRLVLAPDLLDVLAKRDDLNDVMHHRMVELQERIKTDKQYQIRVGFRPEELDEEEQKILLEEAEDTEDVRQNIYAKLQAMTPAEKSLLALKANRMTRMILVKDPNPLVCKAVMRSPMLNEHDVERVSSIREVNDEVIRIIAGNRRWMRKYAILRNVALNPRTPIAISLNLLERLQNNDIKLATREHNIANAVKQAIKRIARTRGLQ